MAVDVKPPGLEDLIRKWVFDHYGVVGLLALGLAVALFYVLSNWDKVSKWPGVRHLLARFKRWRIPKADPNRFSVMVARLDNDENHRQYELIVEDLKEFKGVQVLGLDRTISVKGPVPEDKEREGHEKARSYLAKTGASVLIWGSVMNPGANDKILKLYWTPSEGAERFKRYDAPLAKDQYRFPEVFWSDLSEVLRLLVASHEAGFYAQKGKYVADLLHPFISRVQTLQEATANSPHWDADARGTTHVILGNALLELGDQSGESGPLKDAVNA